MTATTTSITFIGSASCLSDTCHTDGAGSAAMELGPCSARRRAASASVRPRSRSAPSEETTASGSCVYQGVGPAAAVGDDSTVLMG